MWCIAALTLEYRKRMYHLLALYALPLRKEEPVVCIDEKSLQLLADSRAPVAMKPGRLRREDYEYVRRGTTNLFVAVEPKAGRRQVVITTRRGKADFVAFVQKLLSTTYKSVRRLHLVVDNLNTHFAKSFVDALGKREATKLLRRVRFHYTPKHASWLNMAEIEIGVLTGQCVNQRLGASDGALKELQRNVCAWQERRNNERKPLNWKFTRKQADEKFRHNYVP